MKEGRWKGISPVFEKRNRLQNSIGNRNRGGYRSIRKVIKLGHTEARKFRKQLSQNYTRLDNKVKNLEKDLKQTKKNVQAHLLPRKPGEMFPHVEDIEAQIKALQGKIEQKDNNPNPKQRLADTKRKEEALIKALQRIQVLEKENDLR